MTPQQQEIQNAMATIQHAVDTINKAHANLLTIPINQDATDIFTKDGLIALLQSGKIMGNVDQNVAKQSLQNTTTITQAVELIHGQLIIIQQNGGDTQKTIELMVQQIQNPNPQAFQAGMANLITGLQSQTGVTTPANATM